ncbi:uncharacterized protein LOC135161430 [Diachasmimorpha longicaudata]|uniref:uncharacterized protein LOC135161430 n=1 Tax=Diachasmimorpha longicaudata TaxID=58733 RepID=UPI0030B8F105
MKAGKCFKCNRFGHTVSDCPQHLSIHVDRVRTSSPCIRGRLGSNRSSRNYPHLRHSMDEFVVEYLCYRFLYYPGYVNLEFKAKIREWRARSKKDHNALRDLPVPSDIEAGVEDVFKLRRLFRENPAPQPCHAPPFLGDSGRTCDSCASYLWDYPGYYFIDDKVIARLSNESSWFFPEHFLISQTRKFQRFIG